MRTFLACLALMILGSAVYAVPAASVNEDKIAFDGTKAEVKQVNGSWKVVVGDLWLLDFAGNEVQARQALEVIQYYHLDAQGFVGRPNAPMQYYLADGKAPDHPMPGEDSIAFRLAKVEVKQIEGRWKVVDGDNWLLDFTTHQDQALQALEIIKKYHVNHICFVGRPNAPMMYFRSGAASYKEDKITFDYKKAEAQFIEGHWKVVVGTNWLLDFGSSEAQAKQALAVIQHYHLNAQCFVGRPNPPMQYYLANGKAPEGPMAGEDCIAFNPNHIEVKLVNGSWKIVEGDHWILDFAKEEMHARDSMGLIRKYGFSNICFVGRPNAPMVYFRK